MVFNVVQTVEDILFVEVGLNEGKIAVFSKGNMVKGVGQVVKLGPVCEKEFLDLLHLSMGTDMEVARHFFYLKGTMETTAFFSFHFLPDDIGGYIFLCKLAYGFPVFIEILFD